MKLTKMPNPRKPVHSPGAKQLHVVTTPQQSPAPNILLLSTTYPTGDKFKGKISCGGAASPVKRPQLKMATPLPVPKDSSRANWHDFSKIQQDRPYNKKPFPKKPRNA